MTSPSFPIYIALLFLLSAGSVLAAEQPLQLAQTSSAASNDEADVEPGKKGNKREKKRDKKECGDEASDSSESCRTVRKESPKKNPEMTAEEDDPSDGKKRRKNKRKKDQDNEQPEQQAIEPTKATEEREKRSTKRSERKRSVDENSGTANNNKQPSERESLSETGEVDGGTIEPAADKDTGKRRKKARRAEDSDSVGSGGAAPAVVRDNLSQGEKRKMAEEEGRRREEKRRRRNELIGAAAAGAVIGAVINELGGKVIGDEGDRVIVERDGQIFVRKDENERLRSNGAVVRNEELTNGHMRTTVTRPNGVQVITIRDSGGFILRRVKVLPNGERIVLVDNRDIRPRDPSYLNRELPPIRVRIRDDEYIVNDGGADRYRLREVLEAEPVEEVERAYSLREIRDSERIRAKTRRIDLDTITFDTGSYSLTESQVERLIDVGELIAEIVDNNPRELFLIEGHTDAVGSNISNLTLSDRRADTIARILTEDFDVPPENMVVQGYGEQYLKVETQGPERANRRVTLRRITPLLQASR